MAGFCGISDLHFNFTLSLRSIFAQLAQYTNSIAVYLASRVYTTQLIMPGHSKNLNTDRGEAKENFTQQDQSTKASKRVTELGRRKYYSRAAKKLKEEICEKKQSCLREEKANKKHREDILKPKHSSEVEAKIYKQLFQVSREKWKSYTEKYFTTMAGLGTEKCPGDINIT